MEKVPVWHKMNLTVEEAARYSGIGENKLREMIKWPDCDFVIRNGAKTLIKRKKLEEYNERLKFI